MVVGGLIGGENANHEKAKLRKGITILVATPGRLLYHLKNTQCFKLINLKHLVLEECDRILDLGFKSQLEEII